MQWLILAANLDRTSLHASASLFLRDVTGVDREVERVFGDDGWGEKDSVHFNALLAKVELSNAWELVDSRAISNHVGEFASLLAELGCVLPDRNRLRAESYAVDSSQVAVLTGHCNRTVHALSRRFQKRLR